MRRAGPEFDSFYVGLPAETRLIVAILPPKPIPVGEVRAVDTWSHPHYDAAKMRRSGPSQLAAGQTGAIAARGTGYRSGSRL